MCPVKVRALRGDSSGALPKAILSGKKLPLKPHFWGFEVRMEGSQKGFCFGSLPWGRST